MSASGRPKSGYRSAQHEGTLVICRAFPQADPAGRSLEVGR